MEEKQRGLRFGSVEFSGYGAFPEQFTTELISRGVELRRVRFGDGTISGSVSPADYWETARTARRCGLRIRAGKRRGLYFTALRYSPRAGLYVGFLAFVMLTALSGSRIQDIEIVSSGTVTAAQRSQIMSILGECGLTEGSSARRLENSTTAAERRILLEIPEAAWVDVTCVGFRLEAAVEMGTPAPEMLDLDAPCNLVASRAAAVVSHVVRDGVLVADTGSGVPEGGLLVSGTVADAAGNVILKHASAEIIGEYTETREFFVPYKETLRLPEGETAEYRWLVYGDDEYPLFFGGAAMEDSVYSEETEAVRLFGKETPLKIRTGRFTGYVSRNVTRSADDCLAELSRQQAAFEENFYAGQEVYSCEKTAVPEQDGIRLRCVYTLRGNIAKEQEILLSQPGSQGAE